MKIINASLFIIAFFLFSCKEKYPYSTDDFSPQLSLHLKKLESERSLPSSDTIARNYLRDSCSKDELVKILECEVPLLRAIAYFTIVNRNEPDYYEILLGHLDDTAMVGWIQEDISGESMVSDMMIRKVTGFREHQLSRIQKDTLVSKVLLNHLYLYTSKEMIEGINPQEKYYSIIRSKAEADLGNCSDLIYTYALAKFEKNQDISLIYSNISNSFGNEYCDEYIFKTIEAFPAPSFYSLLQKYFDDFDKKEDRNNIEYFTLAVACYKNENSLKILSSLSNNFLTNYEKGLVFRAIHKYKSPIYSDPYKKLQPQMEDYVIENLELPRHYSIW